DEGDQRCLAVLAPERKDRRPRWRVVDFPELRDLPVAQANRLAPVLPFRHAAKRLHPCRVSLAPRPAFRTLQPPVLPNCHTFPPPLLAAVAADWGVYRL